jgi:hypothetical protein
MSDAVFRGELPHYGNVPARFRAPSVSNVPNRFPIEQEADMAARSKPDSVTWPQFGIICGIVALFLGAIAILFNDNMKDVKHAIDRNTTEIGGVRERVAEISTKLDVLITETRQNRRP